MTVTAKNIIQHGIDAQTKDLKERRQEVTYTEAHLDKLQSKIDEITLTVDSLEKALSALKS